MFCSSTGTPSSPVLNTILFDASPSSFAASSRSASSSLSLYLLLLFHAGEPPASAALRSFLSFLLSFLLFKDFFRILNTFLPGMRSPCFLKSFSKFSSLKLSLSLNRPASSSYSCSSRMSSCIILFSSSNSKYLFSFSCRQRSSSSFLSASFASCSAARSPCCRASFSASLTTLSFFLSSACRFASS